MNIIHYIGFPLLILHDSRLVSYPVLAGVGIFGLCLPFVVTYILTRKLGINPIFSLAWLTPWAVWFLYILLPVANKGVGNFVLELAALINVFIVISISGLLSVRKWQNRNITCQITCAILAGVGLSIITPHIGK
jgi:uncharacterized membrane protein (DUF485 family)